MTTGLNAIYHESAWVDLIQSPRLDLEQVLAELFGQILSYSFCSLVLKYSC